MRVQLDTGTPVIYGVLNCLTEEQAMQRAGVGRETQGHNHGIDWGQAAVELGVQDGAVGERDHLEPAPQVHVPIRLTLCFPGVHQQPLCLDYTGLGSVHPGDWVQSAWSKVAASLGASQWRAFGADSCCCATVLLQLCLDPMLIPTH